jgi:hypothetical protein
MINLLIRIENQGLRLVLYAIILAQLCDLPSWGMGRLRILIHSRGIVRSRLVDNGKAEGKTGIWRSPGSISERGDPLGALGEGSDPLGALGEGSDPLGA